jgi:hypothetical protein
MRLDHLARIMFYLPLLSLKAPWRVIFVPSELMYTRILP